jgi:hypothetical protein
MAIKNNGPGGCCCGGCDALGRPKYATLHGTITTWRDLALNPASFGFTLEYDSGTNLWWGCLYGFTFYQSATDSNVTTDLKITYTGTNASNNFKLYAARASADPGALVVPYTCVDGPGLPPNFALFYQDTLSIVCTPDFVATGANATITP